MSISPALPALSDQSRFQVESGAKGPPGLRNGRARKGPGSVGAPIAPIAHYAMANFGADGSGHRHAELFYLQKQIHSQTPMVIVLEDGERVEGCLEWYDRNSIKVRGRVKSLVYKNAIKYMYKLGEGG